MKVFILFISMFLICSCSSKSNYQEIISGGSEKNWGIYKLNDNFVNPIYEVWKFSLDGKVFFFINSNNHLIEEETDDQIYDGRYSIKIKTDTIFLII